MQGPDEPSIEQLGGRSPTQIARRYGFAVRPAFLPASILPVVVGTAWGQSVAGRMDWLPAGLALLATVLVHAGANVINDVGDELGGSDRANVERMFPYTGGSRVIQNGILTTAQMRLWGNLLMAFSALLGAMLAALKGPVVVWLGLAGIALAVSYSMRPLQLAARGVGELAIGIGFGVLPVVGAAWVQSNVIDGTALLVAAPCSAWVMAILLINEVPDLRADAATGKRTLPVRIGIDATRVIYIALNAAALLAAMALVWLGVLHWLVLTGCTAIFVVALVAARGIRGPTGENREPLRRSIVTTIAVQALGSLWLAVWCWNATV